MRHMLVTALIVACVMTGCNTLTNPQTVALVGTFLNAAPAVVQTGLAIYQALQEGRDDDAQASAGNYTRYLDAMEVALNAAAPYLPESVVATARTVIAEGRVVLASLVGQKLRLKGAQGLDVKITNLNALGDQLAALKGGA